MPMEESHVQSCQDCGTARTRRFQALTVTAVGEPSEEQCWWLCARCARLRRRQSKQGREGRRDGLTRAALIGALDRFFAESGALEICRRCHAQGTGCCPQSCRALGPAGCRVKNVFCSAFICSALLNAIRECDPEAARVLKWATRHLGPAEYRLYEMMTRVPAEARASVRPLALPDRYPGPLALDGSRTKGGLAGLASEVLEIRRRGSAAGEG